MRCGRNTRRREWRRLPAFAAETIVRLAREYAMAGRAMAVNQLGLRSGGDPVELWDSAQRIRRHRGSGCVHAAAADGCVEVQGRRSCSFRLRERFRSTTRPLQMPELMLASPLGRRHAW